MPKFIIEGKRKLEGEIEVKGSKNAALKAIPASILSKSKMTLQNIPDIEDVHKALSLLSGMGANIDAYNNDIEIDTSVITNLELSPEIADKFRASIVFVGPTLARFGEVIFPHPGGCAIEATGRPIDLFLDGFKALGAEIETGERHYCIRAEKLKSCEFFFPIVSVTATESLMMTAVLADGETILKNCAMEPEIIALADYLNNQGAKIAGAGTPVISIKGVREINAGIYKNIPDRIETGSFAMMAALIGSEIVISRCSPEHIQVLLTIFNRIGVRYETREDWIRVYRTAKILPYSIKTHEYPGFATDLQPIYTLLMTQACGTSLIHEVVYDRRLLFTDMLVHMGANITMCDPHRVVVSGPTKLYGRNLASPDLRAGIAIVLAGLIAEGRTVIDNIYQIDRGYEDIGNRLKNLGAHIERVE